MAEGDRRRFEPDTRHAGRPPPGSRLPAAIQTALFLRDPIGYLERLRARYGPVFRMPFIGVPHNVYVAESRLARQAFATDRGGGRAGAVRREFLAPLVGEHSLLTLDGDRWLRHRRVLGPAFHGPAVESFRDEIAAIAAAEVARWPLGEPLALRPAMQRITLELILRVVFGIRDDERLESLRRILPPLLDGPHWLAIWALPEAARRRLLTSQLTLRLSRNPIARFRAGLDELNRLLHAEIRERRATQEQRHDALGIMLAARDDEGRELTDTELRDELVTLLTAGHETTATALAWAFERLSRTPRVTNRLRESIAAGETDYLDAVAKEALRSRPVVLDAPRLLDDPLELGDYTVPAGWMVGPAIPLVQRDRAAYPRPDEFRPERFLDRDRDLHAWVPFGGGMRRCLGSHLAMLELRTVIAEVMASVELDAGERGDERPRVRHVTLVPDDGARVVIHSLESPRPAK